MFLQLCRFFLRCFLLQSTLLQDESRKIARSQQLDKTEVLWFYCWVLAGTVPIVWTQSCSWTLLQAPLTSYQYLPDPIQNGPWLVNQIVWFLVRCLAPCYPKNGFFHLNWTFGQQAASIQIFRCLGIQADMLRSSSCANAFEPCAFIQAWGLRCSKKIQEALFQIVLLLCKLLRRALRSNILWPKAAWQVWDLLAERYHVADLLEWVKAGALTRLLWSSWHKRRAFDLRHVEEKLKGRLKFAAGKKPAWCQFQPETILVQNLPSGLSTHQTCKTSFKFLAPSFCGHRPGLQRRHQFEIVYLNEAVCRLFSLKLQSSAPTQATQVPAPAARHEPKPGTNFSLVWASGWPSPACRGSGGHPSRFASNFGYLLVG